MPPSTTVYSNGNVTGDKLIVDFIDVGQGNCVLVTMPNGEFLLADCGSQNASRSGVPYSHALNYITAVTGGQRIHTIVLSHGEKDHTALVPHVAEAQQPKFIHCGGKRSDYYGAWIEEWLNGMKRRKGTTVAFYRRDTTNTEPSNRFPDPANVDATVLCANHGDSNNGRSLILRLRFGDDIVILPGDADFETELFLIGLVPGPLLSGCTLLMPGHHGALSSTSTQWVKKLDPDVAVISSSGTNSGYAHPACLTNEILEPYLLDGVTDHAIICSAGKISRYTRSRSTDALLTTATNGDVRYTTNGNKFKIQISSLGAPQLSAHEAHNERLLRQLVPNGPWRPRRVSDPLVPGTLGERPAPLVREAI